MDNCETLPEIATEFILRPFSVAFVDALDFSESRHIAERFPKMQTCTLRLRVNSFISSISTNIVSISISISIIDSTIIVISSGSSSRVPSIIGIATISSITSLSVLSLSSRIEEPSCW